MGFRVPESADERSGLGAEATWAQGVALLERMVQGTFSCRCPQKPRSSAPITGSCISTAKGMR